MTVLLALLVGAAWFGYGATTGQFRPEPVRICNTPGPGGEQTVAAKDVTVNVYNAGDEYGLASQTASELRERGMKVGEVANAPDESDVSTALVRGRAKNAPEVLLLRRHLDEDVRVAEDQREGYTVDLIVGNKFDSLGKAPKKVLTIESPLAACTTAIPTDA